MRKVLTLIVLLMSMALSLFQLDEKSFATDPVIQSISSQTLFDMPHGADQIGVLFNDSNDQGFVPSILYGYNFGGRPYKDMAICASLNDPTCKDLQYFHYYSILQPCKGADGSDCIEEFYGRNISTEEVIKGTVDSSFPKIPPNAFSVNSEYKIPQGGASTIYNLPSIKAQKETNKYMVSIVANGFLKRTSNGFTEYVEDMQNTKFTASIAPVVINQKVGARPSVGNVYKEAEDRVDVVFQVNPGGPNCFATDYNLCALQQSFESELALGIKLRLSREMRTWLHGRISDPYVQYSTSRGVTRLQVEGLPVETPIVGGWVNKSKIESSDFPAISPTQSLGYLSGPSSSDVEGLNAWMKYLNSQSLAVQPQWTFRELGLRELNNLSSNIFGSNVNQNARTGVTCLKATKTFAGIVSSNATAFAAGPPIYSPEEDSFDYKVSSPRTNSGGTKNRGTYDLYIAKSFMECIYKNSVAPTSATVSIVYESQEPVISIVSVKKNGDLYHLSVKGFSYDSPLTLKVRFKDVAQSESVPTPSPSASATPIPYPSKQTIKLKTTITCAKGKTVKRVTSTNPKCPTGFKKR
jgi:hypothetical protein